jgi:hypothetical protein
MGTSLIRRISDTPPRPAHFSFLFPCCARLCRSVPLLRPHIAFAADIPTLAPNEDLPAPVLSKITTVGRTPVPFNALARGAAKAKELGLVESARLFALLSMAGSDSQIVTWEAKYLDRGVHVAEDACMRRADDCRRRRFHRYRVPVDDYIRNRGSRQ